MPDLIPAEDGIFDRHPEYIEITCIWLRYKSQLIVQTGRLDGQRRRWIPAFAGMTL